MLKAAAVVALLWAAPCEAQNSQGGTRIIALPGGTPSGSSIIISGATPCTGCASGGVLFNNGGVVTADSKFLYGGAGSPYVQLNGNGFLTSPATGTWQFGAMDGSSPVAQTTKVQSPTGMDASGVNWLVIGSLNTGAGTPGNIVFQTGATGVSGSAQAVPVTQLTIEPGLIVSPGQFASNKTGGGSAAAFFAAATAPGYAWAALTQAADQKYWDVIVSGLTMNFRALSDNQGTANAYMVVNRGSGATVSNVTIPTTLLNSGIASAAQADVVCTTSAGQFSYQVSATGCAASSERFKDMLDPLTEDDSVRLARGLVQTRRWTYKDPKFGDPSEYVGFTAEQVAGIDDRFITRDAGGLPYAVKHQQLAEAAMTGFALMLRKFRADFEAYRLEHP